MIFILMNMIICLRQVQNIKEMNFCQITSNRLFQMNYKIKKQLLRKNELWPIELVKIEKKNKLVSKI